jgi:hypothetical protein
MAGCVRVIRLAPARSLIAMAASKSRDLTANRA